MHIRNLFFDFDGFLFNTHPMMLAYINQKYGIEATLNELANKCSDLELVVNAHLDDTHHVERNALYKDYIDNFITSIEWHRNIQPFPDMCEVIASLERKYDIWIVTARSTVAQATVDYLLDRYIPRIVKGKHFVWHYQDNDFHQSPKKKFIEEIPGVHVGFFDDSPHEIEKMGEIITSHLFDPYGFHTEKYPHIRNRVHSWKEIGTLLL